MKKIQEVIEYAILVDGEQVGTHFATETDPLEIADGQEAREIHRWVEKQDGSWLVSGSTVAPAEYVRERDIPHEIRPWRPFMETTPYDKSGQDVSEELRENGEVFLANSHYLVFRRELRSMIEGQPPQVHLSLRTVENDTRHDWREMQRIKNELCGPDWEAVELYPREDRIVDQANQYHLWCFAFQLPFGFDDGVHTATTEEAAEVGATQR